MAHYNTILNQLLLHVPRHQFDRLVETHKADRYAKTFSTWNQLTVMLYAQASGKESLREIEQGLETQESKTYHVGLAGPVRRTTLADANGRRKWEIFRGVFGELLTRCRSVTPKHKFRFKNPLYSIDSTVNSLCLSLFPWARYRTAKGGLKLHYQLDYAGHIPSLMVITEGRENDVSVAKKDIPIEPDSIYCFDRGYVDFGYFRRLENMGCTFVTRMKKNLSYRVTGQQECLKNRGVLMDATIERGQGEYVGKDCPLRLIRYYDKENDRTLEFLTNNMTFAATTIAEIYKARWQIEAFFKWIKQNLKIKTFLGTTENAVLSQIWVAMIYYLLLAYIKYQTKYGRSLFYLHRVIKETLLDRISLMDLLNLNEARLKRLKRLDPQLHFSFIAT